MKCTSFGLFLLVCENVVTRILYGIIALSVSYNVKLVSKNPRATSVKTEPVTWAQMCQAYQSGAPEKFTLKDYAQRETEWLNKDVGPHEVYT